MKRFLILFITLLFIPLIIIGATLFIDSFNNYTDGDLNTQGDWSANSTFDIQGTTVYEGSKAVYWAGETTDVTAEKTGTSQNDGIIYFYVRRGDKWFYRLK